jgi:hypothetical protein
LEPDGDLWNDDEPDFASGVTLGALSVVFFGIVLLLVVVFFRQFRRCGHGRHIHLNDGGDEQLLVPAEFF